MLTQNQVKEELSYAYIHAVAARAQCRTTKVHPDMDSTDVQIDYHGLLDPESVLSSPSLKIQLKATAVQPACQGNQYAFPLALKNYNDLRALSTVPRLLAILFMPEDDTSWLQNDADSLIAKRCMYWCSLSGKPDSANVNNQTIYIPDINILDVTSLRTILARISKREEIGNVL